jgi:hypothetical protein
MATRTRMCALQLQVPEDWLTPADNTASTVAYVLHDSQHMS